MLIHRPGQRKLKEILQRIVFEMLRNADGLGHAAHLPKANELRRYETTSAS
jgi:hypothetical protein